MMNEEDTFQLEAELARLQAENARLHAMIDHLERRSADEPVPLAAETQIIRAEPETPAPARRARKSERPLRARKKRKQKRSLLDYLLLFLAALPVLAIIIYLSALLFEALGFNFSWLKELQALDFLFGFISFVVLIASIPIITKVQEEIRWYQRFLKSRQKKQPQPLRRRRITRKLRAATTQKLNEGDAD